MRIRLSQLRRIIKEEVQRTLREGEGDSYYTDEIKAIVDKLYDDAAELSANVELDNLAIYYTTDGSDLRKTHGEKYEIDTDALQKDPKFQKEYYTPYADDPSEIDNKYAIVRRTGDWQEGTFKLDDDAGDSYYTDNKAAVDDAYDQASDWGSKESVKLTDLVPAFKTPDDLPVAVAVGKLLADKGFKAEYEVEAGAARQKPRLEDR